MFEGIITLLEIPRAFLSANLSETFWYVSATMSTRLYPDGSCCKHFHVRSSDASGTCVMLITLAIISILNADTVSFGGQLSLGCNKGLFTFLIIISVDLLFVVTLLDPSGLAKLSRTGHKGHSSALLKSTACPLFAENEGNVPKIFQLTSTDFIFLFCSIVTFLLDKCD